MVWFEFRFVFSRAFHLAVIRTCKRRAAITHLDEDGKPTEEYKYDTLEMNAAHPTRRGERVTFTIPLENFRVYDARGRKQIAEKLPLGSPQPRLPLAYMVFMDTRFREWLRGVHNE